MKRYLPHWFPFTLALLTLGSCTPSGELISRTSCNNAIAVATQTWEVDYYTSKAADGANAQRIQEFDSNTLTNRNGEQPEGAIASPDDNGIWWAPLPPRPNADAIDQFRKSGEFHDPPRLQRSVKYQLICEDGTLLTDARTYREVARTVRTGQAVTVSYSLNRVLQVEGTTTAATSTPNPASDAPATPAPSPAAQRSPGILYVDSQTGQENGDGSQERPLKTITAALGRATAGDMIQLRPGTYTVNSGEIFPLQLKPGVSLQGNSDAQGQGIVIEGGGNFLSPTWAQQNVTLVAVPDSQVQGLTLTNPNTRGTAIWVETGSPTIARNTLINNNRDGIFVSSSATPVIRNNRFEQNKGNGISFTRSSGGLVEDNVIRSSGFGMAIGDRATPELRQNQVTENRDGLVINGQARPILKLNTITGNERNGIVVTQAAVPQLQQNRLSQNGQFDLNNATNRPLEVAENDLIGLKVQGATQ